MDWLITEFLHKKKSQNEATIKISFSVVHVFAKQEKPFTNSNLIKIRDDYSQ